MIFGESGGGGKVCTLLAMPSAQGLFHRAAIQSSAALGAGLGFLLNTREANTQLAEAMLKELGVAPEHIDDLQTMPVDRLLAAMSEVLKHQSAQAPGAIRGGFGPVVDGTIVPTHPFDPVATPVSPTIPILIGCNTHEQAYFSMSAGDDAAFNLDEAGLRQRVVNLVGAANAGRVIDTYQKMHPGQPPSELYFLLASDQSIRVNEIRLAERKFVQGKAPVYMYLFAWQTPALGGKMRAPHTVEIPFVFDNTDIPKMMTTGSQAEKELAAKMSEAWIQFARSGNPNHKGLPNWPAYTIKDRATMVFDTTCKVVNDPGSEERKLWASF